MLGLGIGASTAVFSLVYGVVLCAVAPFRDPAQLVTVQIHIREMEDRFPASPASLRALEAWAGEPRSLQGSTPSNRFSSLSVRLMSSEGRA